MVTISAYLDNRKKSKTEIVRRNQKKVDEAVRTVIDYVNLDRIKITW